MGQRLGILSRGERALLAEHGFYPWPVGPDRDVKAVRAFQRAWANGPLLQTDGVIGPKTRAALQTLPYLSPHFVVAELWDWRESTCFVRRDLLLALEQLRAAAQKPIALASGYRTLSTNTVVGGAPGSVHLHGLAADITTELRLTFVKGLRIFSGLGVRKNGTVAHVDLRHLVDGYLGSPDRPARWSY